MPSFGVDFHPAMDHEHIQLQLGVMASGIVVYLKENKINSFSWSEIQISVTIFHRIMYSTDKFSKFRNFCLSWYFSQNESNLTKASSGILGGLEALNLTCMMIIESSIFSQGEDNQDIV